MQGDSLSPILFDIVVDMLAITIARAKDDQIKGIVPHFIEDDLSRLHSMQITQILLCTMILNKQKI
jgi:hypothetical protein